MLQPEQLPQREVTAKRAQLILKAYSVLVLSNEWLKDLFYPSCGAPITEHDQAEHSVHWAPKDLWEQVSHLDPIAPNPTVSQFTRRLARSTQLKWADGHRFHD